MKDIVDKLNKEELEYSEIEGCNPVKIRTAEVFERVLKEQV